MRHHKDAPCAPLVEPGHPLGKGGRGKLHEGERNRGGRQPCCKIVAHTEERFHPPSVARSVGDHDHTVERARHGPDIVALLGLDGHVGDAIDRGSVVTDQDWC